MKSTPTPLNVHHYVQEKLTAVGLLISAKLFLINPELKEVTHSGVYANEHCL